MTQSLFYSSSWKDLQRAARVCICSLPDDEPEVMRGNEILWKPGSFGSCEQVPTSSLHLEFSICKALSKRGFWPREATWLEESPAQAQGCSPPGDYQHRPPHPNPKCTLFSLSPPIYALPTYHTWIQRAVKKKSRSRSLRSFINFLVMKMPRNSNISMHWACGFVYVGTQVCICFPNCFFLRW